MKLELFELGVLIVCILIILFVFYRKKGRNKSFANFIFSKLLKLWGKIINFLIILAIVWFSLKIGSLLLRRIL
ncbi:hypothetical protein [Orenia marismortui]|uniref:Uncharacterized protein n=1 Tax=Orenia marismortui TaxID=46469 RepID=A0A4R8GYG5_9FIRM|nr:hypothetical protein [Orenia marismortui]TDX51556.1 hypothetical protein C7959_11256 [Orenia marismortui]